jgi:hypothetical protein
MIAAIILLASQTGAMAAVNVDLRATDAGYAVRLANSFGVQFDWQVGAKPLM